jgi:hypothetical protein
VAKKAQAIIVGLGDGWIVFDAVLLLQVWKIVGFVEIFENGGSSFEIIVAEIDLAWSGTGELLAGLSEEGRLDEESLMGIAAIMLASNLSYCGQRENVSGSKTHWSGVSMSSANGSLRLKLTRLVASLPTTNCTIGELR